MRATYRGYLAAAIRPGNTVVVKDPTAALMTAWIAGQLNARVLLVLRHPCGFASSLGSLGWELSVTALLRQKRLMKDHLGKFHDVLTGAKNDEWLTRGAFWGAIHTVFARQSRQHTDWITCKYEDICRDPLGNFSAISKKLGLELSDRTRKKIKASSTLGDSDQGSTRRNSNKMPGVWRQRMSQQQIDSVMGVVNEFGLDYYPR